MLVFLCAQLKSVGTITCENIEIMSRSKAKAVNVDDIWSILEKTKENPDETSDSHDVGVLIVGEPGCGKSSLLQSFLKPNVTKDPKPTFALEYNFVRKKQISTKVASKAVSHLWELGGDIFEPKMLEIPLALKTLKYTSVIICCDLSKPNNVIPSLLKWITCVTDCVQKQYNKTVSDEENSFDIQEYLKNKSQYCYGAEHPDLQKVSVGPISLYIALTKYDQFKTRNSVECRAILQAIRFIAHAHCASIITTCSVDAALRESFRSVFNQICFSGAAFGVKVGLDVQSDRPINVQAGKDSFGSILMPGSGKVS